VPPTPAVVTAVEDPEVALEFLVPDEPLWVELAELDGFVTVTVAVLVVLRLVFSVTVRVAVNVILSPEAADEGTESLASACGFCLVFGTLIVQLVVLAQPTVNVGVPMAGDLLLPVAVTFTVALSASDSPAAHAEIVKLTELPAWTLLSEAVTATLGAA
jgi:hypothetical protein